MERRQGGMEPFLTSLPPLDRRAIGGNHVAVEDGAGQEVRCLQGSDATLTGGYNLAESIEQIRIVAPPLIRSIEVSGVTAICDVVFVEVQPPCDAEVVSW